MRPSTALSADGPLNFYNAVAVAANKDAAGRGVLVVVNDWIHGAASLTKTSTTAVQTFLSPLSGLIGTVAYGERRVLPRPGRQEHRSTRSSRSTASRRCRAWTSSWPTRTWTARSSTPPSRPGAKGIVIAGVGNGNLTASRRERARRSRRRRASSACARRAWRPGVVGRNVELDDDKLGFVASMDHNPQKARVLLRPGAARTAQTWRICSGSSPQYFERSSSTSSPGESDMTIDPTWRRRLVVAVGGARCP